MTLSKNTELCKICGAGLAVRRREIVNGVPLYHRYCSACTSDYAGTAEMALNKQANKHKERSK